MQKLTQLIDGPYFGTTSGNKDGQKIILLPALGFGPELWADAATILAKHYHITSIELPTLKQLNTDTQDGPALHRYTQWLANLLRHEQYQNATLVGIDFSAQLALRALIDNTKFIERVIVFAPTGLRHPIASLVKVLRLPIIGELILTFAAAVKLKKLITPHVYNKDRLPVNFLSRFFTVISDKHRQQATLDIIRNIDLHENDELILNQLNSVKNKTTLAWGEFDKKLSLQYGYQFSKIINLSLNKINYAGHLPPIEQNRWTASLIANAIDKSKPIHIDLKGYNGVACADYIVRTEIAAKNYNKGTEFIIHTLYQCAGDDAKTWNRLTDKFNLIDINYINNEWQIRVSKN